MENRGNRNRFRPYDKNARNRVRRYFNNNVNPEGPVGARSDRIERNKRKQNAFEARRPIGFRTLENVFKIDGDTELILKLSSERNGFLLLLDQPNIRADFMCLILSVLARVSESVPEKDTVHLLGIFFKKIISKLNDSENFYRELKLYIADLSNHIAEQSLNRQKHIDAVQSLLVFLRQLQLTIYTESFAAVRDLVQLVTVQIEFLNRNGNALNEFIVGRLAELNESIGNFAQMRDETERTEALMGPPDDFRKIGIYPDAFDILSNHVPFIRENVVEGKYVAGVNHYLDVQFRLLREDFIRPLRDGINEYRHIKNKLKSLPAAKFRLKELNVYQNVRIMKSEILHHDLVHSCQFDCTPFRNIRWQVGSLGSINFTFSLHF